MSRLPTEVHWKDVEAGKQYKYEEKYDLQFIVTVLEKVPDKGMYRYKLRVDKVCGGICAGSFNIGREFEAARSNGEFYDFYMVTGHKFLTLDSSFSYIGQEELKEIKENLSKIKKEK